jgi:acyl-CoA thioesterase I
MNTPTLLTPATALGLGTAVEEPSAPVIPTQASSQARAQLRLTVSAWSAAIAAAARPYGARVLVVDLLPASKQLPQHAEWISADGFHPSPKGYQKLAALTLEATHRAGWLPTQAARERP